MQKPEFIIFCFLIASNCFAQQRFSGGSSLRTGFVKDRTNIHLLTATDNVGIGIATAASTRGYSGKLLHLKDVSGNQEVSFILDNANQVWEIAVNTNEQFAISKSAVDVLKIDDGYDRLELISDTAYFYAHGNTGKNAGFMFGQGDLGGQANRRYYVMVLDGDASDGGFGGGGGTDNFLFRTYFSNAFHNIFTVTTGSNDIAFGGITSDTNEAITLGAAATTFAVTSNLATITGDTGANTVATITGGISGAHLILLFVDGLVTITDTDAHTANTVDLSAAFTSADDTVLHLFFDGTSWYEISRSAN